MKNGPYELVIAPEGYPGKRYRGRYVYEHQLVWWQNTGSLVPDGFLIHHKNEQKRDNRFENLELQKREAHTKHHAKPSEFIEIACCYCGLARIRLASTYRQAVKRGRKKFYCSQQHQALDQGLGRIQRSDGPSPDC